MSDDGHKPEEDPMEKAMLHAVTADLRVLKILFSRSRATTNPALQDILLEMGEALAEEAIGRVEASQATAATVDDIHNLLAHNTRIICEHEEQGQLLTNQYIITMVEALQNLRAGPTAPQLATAAPQTLPPNEPSLMGPTAGANIATPSVHQPEQTSATAITATTSDDSSSGHHPVMTPATPIPPPQEETPSQPSAPGPASNPPPDHHLRPGARRRSRLVKPDPNTPNQDPPRKSARKGPARCAEKPEKDWFGGDG